MSSKRLQNPISPLPLTCCGQDWFLYHQRRVLTSSFIRRTEAGILKTTHGRVNEVKKTRILSIFPAVIEETLLIIVGYTQQTFI